MLLSSRIVRHQDLYDYVTTQSNCMDFSFAGLIVVTDISPPNLVGQGSVKIDKSMPGGYANSHCRETQLSIPAFSYLDPGLSLHSHGTNPYLQVPTFTRSTLSMHQARDLAYIVGYLHGRYIEKDPHEPVTFPDGNHFYATFASYIYGLRVIFVKTCTISIS